MSDERRYSEQEIVAIFEQATEAQQAAQRHLPQGEGLTLAELQQIGKDAGITPEFIAHAVANHRPSIPAPRPKTYLGLPISAKRTFDLRGPLSDEAWDLLVADLRETFQAAGKVEENGSVRHWRNGNLHAFVEPTASGYRLRMHTLNEYWRSFMTGSTVFLAMGLMFMLVLMASGKFLVDLDGTVFLSMFTVAGLGGLGLSAYRLPHWVREREQQMDAIAARAIDLAGGIPAPELHESVPALNLEALEEAPADGNPVQTQQSTRA